MATGLTAPTQAPQSAPPKPPLWHYFCCQDATPARSLCGLTGEMTNAEYSTTATYQADDCAACILEDQRWKHTSYEHHWSCPNHPRDEAP